jgi:DNA-binding transcriptional LysR family regulator
MPSDWEIGDGDEIDLAELKDRPFVSSFDQTALAIESRRLLADSGVNPAVVARSHSYYVAGALVQRGIGYSLLETLTVRAMLNNRSAAPVTIRRIRGNPALPVSVIIPSQRQLSNPAKAFIECFQATFENLQNEMTRSFAYLSSHKTKL